ncbi:MAG: LysM peptidoglycan-binding domain-containing protein [Planctomycetia bacterium]|nr:LysM peptidoglycan-binding domain-containing protein [Planctomycetia bacterium]
MISTKNFFLAAILVAVLYGVYAVINRNPGSGTLPDAARDVTDMLNVDPGTGSSTPGSLTAGPGMAPPFTPGGGSPAPQFGATPTSDAPPYAPGGAAPPFNRNLPTTTAPPFDASQPAAAPTTASPVPSDPGAFSPYPPPSADAAPTGLAPPEVPRALAPPPMGNFETGMPAPAADFPSLMAQVDQELAAGRLADAHLMLSRRYDDPALAPAERGQIEQLLDQLAGTIIYSREHVLEQPYVVLPTDTLQKIAERCNVPSGLLAKINCLDPKTPLQPGQQLKVVRGPFDATISLDRHEMTLKLAGERYAGRFPIGVGPDLVKSEGTFMVTDKTDVSALPGEEKQTWGTRWIGLGRDLGIHGTSDPESIGKTTNDGYIRLGNRDVEDLFDILSIGSKVIIRR